MSNTQHPTLPLPIDIYLSSCCDSIGPSKFSRYPKNYLHPYIERPIFSLLRFVYREDNPCQAKPVVGGRSVLSSQLFPPSKLTRRNFEFYYLQLATPSSLHKSKNFATSQDGTELDDPGPEIGRSSMSGQAWGDSFRRFSSISSYAFGPTCSAPEFYVSIQPLT